jgi:sugar lactone lactonase YvrE
MTKCDLIIDAKAELGEGPIWDSEHQVLYWVDIIGQKLHIYDPALKVDRSIPLGQYVSAVVPRSKGGVALTTQNGFFRLDLNSGELQPITDPESEKQNNRFNDGKCDAAGRFWAGTMSINGTDLSGSLYCLEIDGIARKVFNNIGISNGIAWSLDNKIMYYVDSPTKQVAAFDYDIHSGTPTNRRVIIDLTNGDVFPDGMTIDEEGMLWVALWDGYRVCRWNPHTGELLQTISIPAAKVSACTFGGRNLDELYITTARENMSAEQLEKEPMAGSVYRVKLDVRGIPAYSFGG